MKLKVGGSVQNREKPGASQFGPGSGFSFCVLVLLVSAWISTRYLQFLSTGQKSVHDADLRLIIGWSVSHDGLGTHLRTPGLHCGSEIQTVNRISDS